jgi:hypothetical protein
MSCCWDFVAHNSQGRPIINPSSLKGFLETKNLLVKVIMTLINLLAHLTSLIDGILTMQLNINLIHNIWLSTKKNSSLDLTKAIILLLENRFCNEKTYSSNFFLNFFHKEPKFCFKNNNCLIMEHWENSVKVIVILFIFMLNLWNYLDVKVEKCVKECKR